jgi:hypothetical protein
MVAIPRPGRRAFRDFYRHLVKTLQRRTAPGSASSTLRPTPSHLSPLLFTGLFLSQQIMPLFQVSGSCSIYSYCHLILAADHTFGHGWYTTFFVLDKYAICAAIAIFEVFFLSSIKRQEVSITLLLPRTHANTLQPLGCHLAGLLSLASVYIGWTYIGYVVADEYVWWFFDHKQIRWEYVVASWFGFAALVEICESNRLCPHLMLTMPGFLIIYGVAGLRELCTKKGEHKSRGYQQLPQ